MSEKLKVVVTGSEGFIAQHVIRKLRALGHEVIGIDSLEFQVHQVEAYKYKQKSEACRFLHGFSGSWSHVYESSDAVIHLGAAVGVGQSMYQPAEYVEKNSHDTARMLEEIKGKTKRLVVASSMSIYGEGPSNIGKPIPTHELWGPNLNNVYALTKYDQEQLCLIMGRAYGVPTTALRFFNVYGPGQSLNNPYTGVLAIFASRLLNDKPPVIYEDGHQSRDFIHVDDIANAVAQAATTDMPGTYNVGTGVGTPIVDVARMLANHLGKDIEPIITGKFRTGDIRHCYADTTRIRSTGWKPMVRLQDGLKEYAEWLLTQPKPEDKFEAANSELERSNLLK